MATVVVTFIVSAAEGLIGGVLNNIKLNDGHNQNHDHPEEQDEGSSSPLFLENSERNALNDFYIFALVHFR